jgi:transcriptional regulator with XRE-family HTH domain
MIYEAKELKKIGDKLKRIRINNGYTSYEKFAIENEISRMQYWRIEEGKTNLTIRSLIAILNIHKITMEKFFEEEKEQKQITIK